MKDYNKYGTPREKKSRIRMLCLTLCMTVLMLTGVGCIPFAKTETVTALQNDLTDAVNELSTLNDAYAAALLEIALLKTAQEEVKKELEALETEHENTKGELSVLENKNQEAEQ